LLPISSFENYIFGFFFGCEG